MWKETLLQVLLALMPIGMFQIWLDRPERSRYVPWFLGISCGLAMLLCMVFSVKDASGLNLDLRFVPLVMGSLYGGVPVAFALLVLHTFIRVVQGGELWSFLLFFLLFFPLLYFFISYYRQASRGNKIKHVYLLSLFLLSLYVALHLYASISDPDFTYESIVAEGLPFAGAFFLAMGTSVHLVEQSFERIRLQSQLKEISLKYRNEVRRLQQFIDVVPLLVLYVHRNGRISHINQTFLKLTQSGGLDQVIDQPVEPFLRRTGLQDLLPLIQRVIKEREQIAEIISYRDKHLYTIVCPLRELPIQQQEGILVVAHDMTEVQQLREELTRVDRLSLVGQMAASITHEIRNPMAVIRGFVQLLKERSPEQETYFRIIMGELDRANAIISDFLSLAQNRIVDKELCHLHDIIDNMMPLLTADANLRGQIVHLKLAEEMDPLELNEKEIKQLLLNLARNGMEAMGEKGELRIETINLLDTVQLRVTDNGIGIPPEKVAKLFEPFYTTKANGTGLGLALCLSIVERHNGKIHVDSVVGKGTTFIVVFKKPDRKGTAELLAKTYE